MLQIAIGLALLALGIIYGIALLVRAVRTRDAFRAERGRFPVLCALEAFLFFLATVGFPDFLLNTLLIRRLKLAEDRLLPGTVVAATITPGAVIAYSLLQPVGTIRLGTLIPCCAAIVLGALTGSRFVSRIDGKKITKVIGIALIFSMGALILRMFLTRGASGIDVGLSPAKLALAVVLSFFWGALNVMGVPMKPAGTAMFLLLGLSPLTTLTMVLVMCSIGPMTGGIPVLMEGRYHQKLACAAALFGSIGAVFGFFFTIAISPLFLNILLLAIMLIAILSMLRSS